jgi:transcriptional regulator with XRE-family HTH domain
LQVFYIVQKKIVNEYRFLNIKKVPLNMTNIREVLAANLRKYRQARGWSQAKLAEKTGTSAQYIAVLEIQGKYPSSEMIHKLAAALLIDPTELFFKEIDPETVIRNTQKAVIEDIGEAVNQVITDFFEEKVKKLDEETGGKGGLTT